MTDETRKRIRAARGYAGLSHAELGERLGVSRDTARRYEDGGHRRLADHDEEALLRRIGDACGLPYEFFTVNFASDLMLLDTREGDAVEQALARIQAIARGALAISDRGGPSSSDPAEEAAQAAEDAAEGTEASRGASGRKNSATSSRAAGG